MGGYLLARHEEIAFLQFRRDDVGVDAGGDRVGEGIGVGLGRGHTQIVPLFIDFHSFFGYFRDEMFLLSYFITESTP